MIVRIVKLTLGAGNINGFFEAFESVKDQIRNFEGCVRMELLTDVEDSGIVFTYSVWNTAHDLERYRQSALFQSTWKAVKPMFPAKAEAWTLNKQVDKL